MPQSYPSKPLTHGNPAFLISLAHLDSVRLAFWQIVQSYESGKPSREVRAGHDIARSTLQRWVQGIRDSGSTRAADNRTSEQNEPVELRRCDRRLEVEVDVSEQAAPVFARRQA